MTTKDGMPVVFLQGKGTSPEDVYASLDKAYPKFFKMDVLSKWAWLGAELLLRTETGTMVYEGTDLQKTGVVLATGNGCLDADKKYLDSTLSIPSPALFVYTLPNIMLGEICIRHGFKGEQSCLIQEHMNSGELYFWVQDLLNNRGMEACLCGWVNHAQDGPALSLFWITKTRTTVGAIPNSPEALEKLKGF